MKNLPKQEIEETNPTTTKTCIRCCQEIHIDAQICNHCGSFQNWRRHLNTSSTFLALLVALVSVVSLSTPILIKAFSKENSDVVVSVTRVFERNIGFVASNQGTRPAIISTAILEVNFDGESWGRGMAPVVVDENPEILKFDDDARYIPQNTTMQFFLNSPSWSDDDLQMRSTLNSKEIESCNLAIQILNFDGSETLHVFDLEELDMDFGSVGGAKKWTFCRQFFIKNLRWIANPSVSQ